MNLKQSDPYIKFKSYSGWHSEKVSGIWVIYKASWYIGKHARIEQMSYLPKWDKLIQMLRTKGIHQIGLEPMHDTDFDEKLHDGIKYLKENGITARSFYNSSPTKELVIDISPNIETIMSEFHKNKRGNVRRALRNGFSVKSSFNISEFLKTKVISNGNKHLINHEKIHYMSKSFGGESVLIVSAYSHSGDFLGSLLNLLWEGVSHSWGIGVTKFGKSKQVTNLLDWEMIKFSKLLGAKYYNLGGVWDERTPNRNKVLHGITQYKSGFGGKYLYYPIIK
ncbi:hypothetical protein A2716_00020 [candidate division WWE3 bacterium RIFCSPHIGHO2_01_FULL_40_23]|nr:MAG: hypothetical protein A2716_00020 [candidate division WWE3 bacterium RIFCSPHIGHO2_01_FULL_40_23]